VLTLLGLQLSAGITTARLRQQVRQAEMERERRTLAAEVHDGLAQYLAVALRELALGDAGNQERLKESIVEAHRLVRARLQELVAPAPLGGLKDAIEQTAERVRRRGLAVRVTGKGDGLGPEAVTLVARVVSEALANVDAHANAREATVQFAVRGEQIQLDVADDGCGFDPATAPGVGEGHLGLTVMRERARAYGGDCTVESAPGAGTRIRLRIPA
jgi:signal transduction histidine kinase